MKEEKLLDAIGMVGDDLIKGAKTPKKKLKKNAIKIVAAVVAASVVVAFIWNNGATVSANYSSKYNRTFGEFAAKTTVELLKGEKENTCYSPVSLFAAMALTAETTKGETRQEILNAFGVDSIEELEEMYKEMSVTLDVDYEPKPVTNDDGKPKPVQTKQAAKITLCNSLWINDIYLEEDSDNVIEQCVKNMKADIFAEGPIDPSSINGWVNEKTNGLIEKIVEDNEDLKIALVNTLYYKSSWKFNFKRKKMNFNLENNKTEEVEFLSASKESMRFKEMNKYTVVEVPLQEGDIMLILPKEGKKLESILNENSINEVLAMSTNDEMDIGLVNISFPKFTIEDSYGARLCETVKSMGVKRLFDDNEWAISDGLNGSLISIQQKTKIIVNEKGIEAAAATAVMSYLSAGPKEIALEISFDRPFMYVLIKNGVPMFMGTVYNPVE